MSVANSYQPKPKENELVHVWDMVIDDYEYYHQNYYTDDIVTLMQERNEFGKNKHGVYLQPHNTRDALADLMAEILDSLAYAQQAILENKDVDKNLQDAYYKLMDILETVHMVRLENEKQIT